MPFAVEVCAEVVEGVARSVSIAAGGVGTGALTFTPTDSTVTAPLESANRGCEEVASGLGIKLASKSVRSGTPVGELPVSARGLPPVTIRKACVSVIMRNGVAVTGNTHDNPKLWGGVAESVTSTIS